MRTTRATSALLVLGVVGGVVLGTGSRAVAQDGDQAPRCVQVKSHCVLEFELGPIDAPEEPFSITGTCAFLHVGQVRVRAEGTARLSGDTMSGTLSGEAVYADANGDQLRSRFIGTFVPEAAVRAALLFANSETVTGGTGRFEGARGTATVTGFADPETGAGGIGADGIVCLGASAGAAR